MKFEPHHRTAGKKLNQLDSLDGKRAVLFSLQSCSQRNLNSPCRTKMPPSQSYKRRRVACQHSPDDQTLRLQAGAGEDDVIHLPSGLDRVTWDRQEEEDPFALAPARCTPLALSVCLSVCLSLSLCLSVSLALSLSLCLCLSVSVSL